MGQVSGKTARAAGIGPEVLKIDPLTAREWRDWYAEQKRKACEVPKGWATKAQLMELFGVGKSCVDKRLRIARENRQLEMRLGKTMDGICALYKIRRTPTK